MIPEIKMLEKFEGNVWTGEVQIKFINALADQDDFQGNASNDPAFSARDRINRGPKSLGFVNLE